MRQTLTNATGNGNTTTSNYHDKEQILSRAKWIYFIHRNSNRKRTSSLSPILEEYTMGKALDKWEGGKKIYGVQISNFKYPNYTMLFAARKKKMIILQKISQESRELRLMIKKRKLNQSKEDEELSKLY